jgi:general secretion pathway protein L
MPAVDPGVARDALGTTVIAAALRWWLDELVALRADGRDAWRMVATRALSLEVDEHGDWTVVRETARGRTTLGTIAGGLDDEALRRTTRRLVGQAKGYTVAVQLPVATVLTRVIRLPAAALKDLASILEFELARHTPFTAARAYYRHRVLGRATAAGTIEVELRVVPRDLVDGLLRRLATAGLSVESITEIGMPARLRGRASLMPPAARAELRWNRSTLALAGATALALVAAIASPIVAAQVRLGGVEREIAALRPSADKLLAERARDARETASYDAVVAAKRAAPPTVEVLAALTRALPDGSWLTGAQLAGRELIVDGYSPAAAALAKPIESLGPFGRVTYRAPITRDPQTGLEQFQFAITLAERAPEGGGAR